MQLTEQLGFAGGAQIVRMDFAVAEVADE